MVESRSGASPASTGLPKESRENGISVFDYEDYHVFLKDWVEFQRKRKAAFSYQILATKAGFKSRSSMRLVCVGERDLGSAAAVNLAAAIGLSDYEREYFLALVGFNNASEPGERSVFLRQMRRFAKPVDRTVLSAQEFDFFGRWYIAAIWELVAAKPFGGDFRELGKMLEPPISAAEARHALKVLLDLGLIEPKGERYIQRQDVLHTRDELISEAIKEYQRETMALAADALERIPPEHRQIGTLTMGLDPEGWMLMKDMVQEFRQKLIRFASERTGVDRVYQVNLQMFPISSFPKD